MGFQCYFSLNFRLKVVERSHNKRHNAFPSQAMRYHYDNGYTVGLIVFNKVSMHLFVCA